MISPERPREDWWVTRKRAGVERETNAFGPFTPTSQMQRVTSNDEGNSALLNIKCPTGEIHFSHYCITSASLGPLTMENGNIGRFSQNVLAIYVLALHSFVVVGIIMASISWLDKTLPSGKFVKHSWSICLFLGDLRLISLLEDVTEGHLEALLHCVCWGCETDLPLDNHSATCCLFDAT